MNEMKIQNLIACLPGIEMSENKKSLSATATMTRFYLTARNDTGIPPGP